MKWLALLVLLVPIAGCTEKAEPMADPPTGEQTQNQESAQGGADGVNVISPAAGAISPVTGSDSVAGGSSGGGGGVGQAAKDQARRAAAKAGGSSLNQYDTGQ